jgi:predicted O-linked N-acetylglucosamine transferase (SPINDLY family)
MRGDAALDVKASIEMVLGHVQQRRFSQARSLLLRVLKADPGSVVAGELMGMVSSELGRHDEALEYLAKAILAHPTEAVGYLNLAKAMQRAGRATDAIEVLRTATGLETGNADVWYSYATALAHAGNFEESLPAFSKALTLEPRHTPARENLFSVLAELRDQKGLAEVGKELMQSPGSPLGLVISSHAMQEHCIWDNNITRLAKLREVLEGSQRRAIGAAYTSMLLWDDPEFHARCARLELPAYLPAVRHTRGGQKSDRIRVAYVSGDFRQHAVSMLIPGLLELHDREQYEITAVSLSASDGSAERARIEKSVDCFLDAERLAGPQIAAMLQDRQIDIAVDLMGHTRNARPSAYMNRAAPVQVNYLGFPGTTAMACYDYMVADPYIVTKALRQATTEKLVVLPDCYLPTDHMRAVAPTPTRAAAGLPETAFVFATFNQSRKITVEAFDVWMSILHEVPGSVLWMRKGSEESVRNLRTEAEQRGVASERLIFAGRVPEIADHLARLSLANLHLDTFPYTSHTTASDTLWAGAPILTRAGRSFQSRVCGSLLTTIGVPELIVNDWQQYKSLAVRLAQNPDTLAAVRLKLEEGRKHSPLFDTRRYCRAMERAYRRMMNISGAGRPPEEIDLSS